MEKPNIWTDPDLCTGCGNCNNVAPDIFKLSDDGVSYVHFYGLVKYDEGISGRELAPSEVDVAIRAAAACPAEIIVVEV